MSAHSISPRRPVAPARPQMRRLRTLGMYVPAVVLALAGAAAPAAAQFLSFPAVPTPPAGDNRVAVAITYGGDYGTDAWCTNQDDYYGCPGSDIYYYSWDYTPPRGALDFTVNGEWHTDLLQVSGPDDACTYSGGYGGYQCTRTYTAAGTIALPENATSTLAAQLQPPYDWAWQAQTVTVGPLGAVAPAVSLAVHPGENRDAARCFLACLEGTAAITTPAYTSLDVPRSVGLLYRSERAQGRGSVVLEVTDHSQTVPQRVGLKLRRPWDNTWVTFDNGSTELFFTPQGNRTIRLAGTFGGYGTDAYQLEAVVTSSWDDGVSKESVTPVVVLVESAAQSPYGAGWQVAGVRRIRGWQGTSAGAVLTDGTGTVQLFRGGCASTQPAWTGCHWDAPSGEFSYIESSPSGDGSTYRQVFPDGSTVGYAISGVQVYAADPLGNRTRYYWRDNDTERLDRIVDPAGQATRFVYDYRGTLAQLIDPMGRTTYVGVDGNGDLYSTTDPGADRPNAHQTIFGYQDHRLTVTVPYTGGRWDYAYNPLGKLLTVQAPAIRTADGSWQRPTTSYHTQEWRMAGVFGGQGTFGDPYKSTYLDNLPTIVVDAAGTPTWVYLDRFGSVLGTVDPLAWKVLGQAWYDQHGHPVRTLGARGEEATYAWNAAKPFLLDSTYDAVNKIGTAYRYDAATHDALRQVLVNGREQQFLTYQGGRVSTARVGGTGQPATRYYYIGQAAGDPRPTAVLDPRGHETTYFYASGGLRNLDSTASAGATASVERDAFGRGWKRTDPLGRVTTTEYDLLNRVRAVTDPAGRTTTTAYDDGAGTTTVTDAVGQTYADSVNALGLATAAVDPARAGTRVTYDAAGHVVQTTNRRGQTVTLGYDPQYGVLTRRTTSDGYTASYGADTLGRWAAADNAEARDTVYRDAAGRDSVVARRFAALPGLRYTVTSRYDSLGRRVRRTLAREGTGPSGRAFESLATGYRYDDTGRLYQVSAPSGDVTFGYNDENGPSSMTLGNSVVVSNGLTALHTLGSQRYAHRFNAGLNTQLDRQFGRVLGQDKAGRVNQVFMTDMMQMREFTFDPAGRLVGDALKSASQSGCVGTPAPGQVAGDSSLSYRCTASWSPSGVPTAFAWDAVGNPAGDVTVPPNSGNQLTRVGDRELRYDADGNLRQRTHNPYVTQNLVWNSLGQLVRVETSDWDPYVAHNWVAFGYDAAGRRARKTRETAGTTTYFLTDGDELLAELNGRGDLVAHYAHHPEGVDAPLIANAFDTANAYNSRSTYYYVREAPGHVLGLLNEDGSIAAQYVDRFGYPAFGAGQAGPALYGGWRNPLQYGGREYDAETGLYYQRARYYDPTLGRFISQDPVGLAGGTNLYAYAGGDPVNHRDPTGLLCDASYWSYSESYERYQFGNVTWSGPRSGPYNFVHHAIACNNPDPGTPASLGGPPGRGGSGAGGGKPTSPPNVVKNLGRTMACSRGASAVMASVQNNFGAFASYEAPFGSAVLTFSPPAALRTGSTIPISLMTPVGTAFGASVYSYNTSVVVQSMSTYAMTFRTMPGHALYPATITFMARGAGANRIRFGVDISGDFANLAWQAAFNIPVVGGSNFEDAVWGNLIANVAASCGGR